MAGSSRATTRAPLRLAGLARLWPTITLPGILRIRATYASLDLDAMPAIPRPLDGTARWLLDLPVRQSSLGDPPDEPPRADASVVGLRSVASDVSVPDSFRRFLVDPELRRHISSATACFLDLGDDEVTLSNGGRLIHFLSDQQWVLHWLLYLDPDGSHAVLASPAPFGLDQGGEEPPHHIDVATLASSAAICADSFEEFLYRYWAMNELFFLVAVDHLTEAAFPDELRRYAEGYPRELSATDIFALDARADES